MGDRIAARARRAVSDGRLQGYAAARSVARRCGFDLVRADFYSPIPDLAALPPQTWDEPAPMPGVDLRLERGLELLEGPLAPFVAEYAPPDGPPGTARGYHRSNTMFGHLDGEVLYALVRHLRPPRVVEVGAGFSTLVIEDAAERNAAEGAPLRHLVFDPYPSPVLERVTDRIELAATRAEDIPLATFAQLEAGDILFVDTTHTVKPRNDVMRLLLEVIPDLAAGVVVHIHDFFRPYEYPRFLADRYGIFWQEQYLVQAFLAFNDAFEVLLANQALIRAHRDRVEAVVPRLPRTWPGSSLWLRKR